MNVATTSAVHVGVRELKNNLSAFLGRVQDGESVIVTDHGRPIARLLAIDAATDTLAGLVAAGAVTAPTDQRRTRPARRVRASGTVSDLVADQRR